MEITRIRSPKVLMVRMTREEAFATIKGMMDQLIANSPNVGRYECYCKDGTDFSISIIPESRG